MFDILEKGGLILVGAVLAWLTAQFRANRAEETAIINDHIKDLEKFCEVVLEYWLQPYDPADEQRAVARVKAYHARALALYPKVKYYCRRDSRRYVELWSSAFKVCMGGSFDTSGRTVEPLVAIDSVDAIATLIAHLRHTRIEILSTRHMLRQLFGTEYV
jgi:hypothetical protein